MLQRINVKLQCKCRDRIAAL